MYTFCVLRSALMAASLMVTASSKPHPHRQAPAHRSVDENTLAAGTNFWRRFIGTAVYEAMKCKAGQPTATAILQRYWIESQVDPTHPLYSMSFDDACRCAGRDPVGSRRRALRRVERAWKLAAYTEWITQYERTRDAVYQLAGVDTPGQCQAVLGLVPIEDYEDVAMLEDEPAQVAR